MKQKNGVYAAVVSVALDNLPLNFCEKRNGMKKFAKAFNTVGKSYAPLAQVNVRKALPFVDAVRSGLIRLSDIIKTSFNTELPSILEIGRGVTCHGDTLQPIGKILRLCSELHKVL